jgi:biotin synthase
MPLTLSTNYSALADKALNDELLTRDEAQRILDTPDDELDELLEATRRVREAHFGRRVKMCVLLNAQSGICPEDCGYCSQSKVSKAPVEKYKLLPESTIIERAEAAAKTGAKRFCMVVAARGAQPRDVAQLCEATRRIKSAPATAHLEICTSLGLLDAEKCRQLKAAGVDYVNHNLNTSEAHYPSICTTHTYADRVETLNNVQAAGLKMCSGGIVGLGESDDDMLDMAFELRKMNVESIPINFLLAIEGTRFSDLTPIEPERGLKVLCLMRLLNPRAEVRMAAGREVHLRDREEQALNAANSLFVNGYLTEPGDPAADVKEWIVASGYEVEV